MPSRLPSVLSSRDLPEAELRAARLDGEVYAVDECFSPVDEVDERRLRAGALERILPNRLIAEQRTAAWVFGVLPLPPATHEVCVASVARARPVFELTRRMAVREVAIDESEITRCYGIRLTTVLRTALDLARFSTAFGAAEHALVRALLALGGLGSDDLHRAIVLRRNLPGRELALARIRDCFRI